LGVVCTGERGGAFPTSGCAFGLVSLAFSVCGQEEEERRSHLPKVHTGQTEGHRSSIEELAGEKGGCEVSLTKTQPTPTKNPTRTTPPHPHRANKTFDTTHPSSDECTGQHSNVLVQRRRSHSNVKQSPLEKRKATNIFPARPGTESGMSSRNTPSTSTHSHRTKEHTPSTPPHPRRANNVRHRTAFQ